METQVQKITDEQMDFIRELVNIGAGNAVTALSQLLQCKVELLMPTVQVLRAHEVAPALTGSPAAAVIGVRMDLIGDVTGAFYVILSKDDLKKISVLIKNVSHWDTGEKDYVLETIAEIGNILAGVYLTAIHDFSSLVIYHTIPRAAIDMIQSLLDETLVEVCEIMPEIFIFMNEFAIKTQSFKMYMLLIPSPDSFDRLAGSLQAARGGIRHS
ncbi:MAG: chemotaxis protein CheC [Methanoregula sp.]|nr:chemotaxis protein CheC [Methanoregula sp.]